jgi:hypothetical protein
LKSGDYMAVSVQGHFDAGMPKAFLDDLRVGALLEHQRSVGVACIVKANSFKSALVGKFYPSVGYAIRE